MRKPVSRMLEALLWALALAMTTTACAEQEELNDIEDIATSYFNALYAQDFDRVAELTAPDVLFDDPTSPPGFIPTTENRDDLIEAYRQSLPLLDQEMKIIRSFASHDKVVLYVTIEGTTIGEFFGHEAKRVAYETEGIAVIQVVDGVVVHHSDYMDYPATFAGLRPVE